MTRSSSWQSTAYLKRWAARAGTPPPPATREDVRVPTRYHPHAHPSHFPNFKEPQ